MKQTKTNDSASEDILKRITAIRLGGGDFAPFFKEDIDDFEKMVIEKNNEINGYLKSKFPFKPLDKKLCDDCDYKDLCLKQYEVENAN